MTRPRHWFRRSRALSCLIFCCALWLACPLLTSSSPLPTVASARPLTSRTHSPPSSPSCPEPELLSPTLLRWKGSLYSLHTPLSLDDPSAPSSLTKKEAKDAEKTAKKASQPELDPVGSPSFYLSIAAAFVCVVVAALAAGLTVGLVSIDPFDLQVILETALDDCETPSEAEELTRNKEAAVKLLPVVRRHHLLLVTLLLLNSAANETLPLFLDALVPSYVAVLISVTLVLVFGEILPSAVFTGAHQLALAARMVPVIYVCLFVFSPIAWPIAKLLDRWLGEHSEEPDLYKRGELKALVKLQSMQHSSSSSSSTSSSSFTSRLSSPRSHTSGSLSAPAARAVEEAGLSPDEVTIITGALEMKTATIGQVCVPLSSVFMLSNDARLDFDTLASMLAVGHSRIPVYDGERHNVTGILLVKRLIVISPEDRRLIRSLSLRRPLFIHPSLSLFDALNIFQRGVSHLAVVCHQPDRATALTRADPSTPLPPDVGIVGIVTLEDLLERLIKEEIDDETDGKGVIRELEGVRVRRKRVAAFRKAAMRIRSARETAKSITPTDLRVLSRMREERIQQRGGGSAGGRGSAEPPSHGPVHRHTSVGLSGGGLSVEVRSPLSAPLYSLNRHHSITQLPSPQSQLLTPNWGGGGRGGAGGRDGYGSVDEATGTAGINRWLRAASRVVVARHERGLIMQGVQEESAHHSEHDDPSPHHPLLSPTSS